MTHVGPGVLDSVGARLEELAKSAAIPGAVAGVDLAGDEVFARHGVTHAEHPLPVDERTLFQIASNSKPFTATLVLSLAGEGALALDDPVSRHLPEFRMPERQHEARVTVRHLLTHRVGWDGDALFIRPPDPPTLGEVFEPMARARQLVPPAGPWTYSNAAFSVAGALVERKTGQPFAEALRERILEPLGLERTVTTADEAIFHRVAMRHLSIPGRDPVPLPGGGWQSGWELLPLDLPAGGIVSCAEDLLRWLRYWLGRGEGEIPGLSPELRAAALESRVDRYNPISSQAIGWAIRHDAAADVYQHGGLTAGYCSYTLFSPSLDLAAVVLTNGTSGAPVHDAFTKWLVGEVGGAPWRDPAPLVPQPDLARYEGRYWGAFGTVTASATEGALELATERHPTDDGSWQPPPERPLRVALYARDHAIVTAPAHLRGTRVEFDPAAEPPAWLRTGGRICVRE